MNNIIINRTHSSTLTTRAQDHAVLAGLKGFASISSALRSKKLMKALERVEAGGLTGHFAFIEIPAGRYAGRVVPTLGFEQGAQVSFEAALLAHHGILVVSLAR